jgi:hypothetical protein
MMPQTAKKLVPFLVDIENLCPKSYRPKAMWVWLKMLCTIHLFHLSGSLTSLPMFTLASLLSAFPGQLFKYVMWVMSFIYLKDTNISQFSLNEIQILLWSP